MSDVLWLQAGTVAYGLAALCSGLGRQPAANAQAVLAVTVCGALAFTSAVIQRWLATGHGPFLTLHEVLLSNACSLGLIYSLIYQRWTLARAGAPLALGVLCALGLWLLNTSREALPLPATYDNPWLWAHVGVGKLFLATCLAATGLALALLLGRVPAAAREASDVLAWNLMALAFVAETFMLIAGAAWAQDAWGRYWSWDPLETSAFITWLTLGFALHVRISHRPAAALGQGLIVLVFILAFLTFFGLPFLSMAPHKGIA